MSPSPAYTPRILSASKLAHTEDVTVLPLREKAEEQGESSYLRSPVILISSEEAMVIFEKAAQFIKAFLQI